MATAGPPGVTTVLFAGSVRPSIVSTARVCFVCPQVYGYFDTELGFTGGGAERQVYLLSTSLADRFDVHVVVGDYGQPQTEQREGVTLHRGYPLQPRQSSLQPVKHLGLLARAMWQASADVYLYRGSPRNAGFVWLASRFLRCPWVYHVANDEYLQSRPAALPLPIRTLFETALDRASGIVAQTGRQQAILDRKYGVEATVIPNGYPVASEPLPASDREFLLWVGRLNKRQKRPHLYLDLAERVPDTECRLVGPVDETDPYQCRIEERANGIQNVVACGELPPQEIHDQYRRAIALVSTARYEGFPNVFLEAWRQATPAVSLDVDTGRFLDTDVPDGYADGSMDRLDRLCAQLIADSEHRRRVGTAAQRYFESNYALGTVVDRYANFIHELL